MLGTTTWFCGVKRAISITDSEYVEKVRGILNNVSEYSKFACPLREQDMRKVNNYPHYLSLIPEGSRCYLIMMQLAGTYVTILYDRSKKAKHPMMVIPMRMTEEVYCSEPVFTCVFNQKTRTLIVDDLIAMNGTVIYQQNSYDRILAVHDMIHNLYRPDTHLLPMKVEVRKYFAYSQLGECLDLAKLLDYPSVGVSIKPSEMTRREMMAGFPRSGTSTKRAKETFRSGSFMVTKGDAPDLYYVALGSTSAPLVVKTLKDSLALSKMFKISPDNAVRMELTVRDGKFFTA